MGGIIKLQLLLLFPLLIFWPQIIGGQKGDKIFWTQLSSKIIDFNLMLKVIVSLKNIFFQKTPTIFIWLRCYIPQLGRASTRVSRVKYHALLAYTWRVALENFGTALVVHLLLIMKRVEKSLLQVRYLATVGHNSHHIVKTKMINFLYQKPFLKSFITI